VSLACGRYVAAFTLDDPDVVVGAALSCPVCLAGDSAIEVRRRLLEPDARGACRACGSTWSLHLEPQQLLRLSLDPPASALVRWVDELPPVVLPNDPEDGPRG
jgi:hypothetical protein